MGRGVGAGLASLLLPGLGQVFTGRRRAGVALFTGVALLAACASALWALWGVRAAMAPALLGAYLWLYAAFEAYDGAAKPVPLSAGHGGPGEPAGAEGAEGPAADAPPARDEEADRLYRRAMVNLMMGLRPVARDQFEAVLERNPRDWDAHYQLGKVYLELGDKEKAREHLEAYLSGRHSGQWREEARRALDSLR